MIIVRKTVSLHLSILLAITKKPFHKFRVCPDQVFICSDVSSFVQLIPSLPSFTSLVYPAIFLVCPAKSINCPAKSINCLPISLVCPAKSFVYPAISPVGPAISLN